MFRWKAMSNKYIILFTFCQIFIQQVCDFFTYMVIVWSIDFYFFIIFFKTKESYSLNNHMLLLFNVVVHAAIWARFKLPSIFKLAERQSLRQQLGSLGRLIASPASKTCSCVKDSVLQHSYFLIYTNIWNYSYVWKDFDIINIS